jgi:pimeloyl-ACP methyl ester carboxylesterase
MRDDLIEFMDLHTLEKAIIIGHSMGGKTAVFLSESNPERIEALVVIDIAPTSYGVDSMGKQAETHKMIMDAMLAVDFSKADNREAVEAQLAETIKQPRIRSFLLKNVIRNKDKSLEWRLNVPVLRQNLDGVLNGLDPKKYRGGEEIAGFPVLFIRGEKSEYISDDDILVIQQIYPMARVTTMPDAGHWLHVEQTALLVKTIRYFL